MSYGKTVIDGYICAVTTGGGTEITEQEYNAILAKVEAMPSAPDGYAYRLRDTDLEWVLVETPPEPDPEVDDAEAFEILLGGAE